MCLYRAQTQFPKGERDPAARGAAICGDALWGLMTMVIILGGILSGVFTATESASIAVLWAFFVTMFIYRDYKWRDLPKLVHRTVKTVCDRDDPDRLRGELRLHHDADADPDQDHHGVLHR
jgi:TRAP-type C4-dicarboxylate transport system permease large subunit